MAISAALVACTGWAVRNKWTFWLQPYFYRKCSNRKTFAIEQFSARMKVNLILLRQSLEWSRLPRSVAMEVGIFSECRLQRLVLTCLHAAFTATTKFRIVIQLFWVTGSDKVQKKSLPPTLLVGSHILWWSPGGRSGAQHYRQCAMIQITEARPSYICPAVKRLIHCSLPENSILLFVNSKEAVKLSNIPDT